MKPRRKASKRGAYEGQLAEPMYPPSVLGTLSELEWAQKRAVKTALLLKHFGIDPNSENAGMELAVALGRTACPRFHAAPKAGPPEAAR